MSRTSNAGGLKVDRRRTSGAAAARRNGRLAAVLVALPVLAVTACGGGSGSGASASSSASGASGDTLVLGAMEDMTGPGANGGEAQSLALKFFIDQQNKAGGVDGHKLDMKVCDTQSTPTGGAACARDLAGVNSHVIQLGGALPSTQGAIAGLSKDVIGSSVLPPLFPKADTQVFQTAPAQGAIIQPFLDAAKKSGVGTIGVLYTSDASGTAQLAAVRKSGSALGMKVIDSAVDPAATDVTTPLLQLKSGGADVIFLASIGKATLTALTSYNTVDLGIPVVSGAQAVTNGFLKSLPFDVPKQLYGVSSLMVGDTSLPQAAQDAWKKFAHDFEAFAHEPPDEETTSGYYAACVSIAALKGTHEGTGAEMSDWLKKNKVTCLGSEMQFNTPGVNVISGEPTAVVQAGPGKKDGWGALRDPL